MMIENEVHIASIIVHVSPSHMPDTRRNIEALEQAEIYAESPEGKIIVVLETENQGFVTDTIDTINNLPNVLNVALVYHEIDKKSHESVAMSTEQQTVAERAL